MRAPAIFLFFMIILGRAQSAGEWALLQPSIGVSAMHMQLLPNDRVVVFDRTDFGLSNLSLPAGRCRYDPNDRALSVDCSAHSAEYHVLANSFRPLTILTDTWCSSGSLSHDGRLIQTGGFNDGERAARSFAACPANIFDCDWEEVPAALTVRRWYSTNHVLPDGRAIIVGGRREFSYEFYPKSDPAEAIFPLPFLRQTKDTPAENNLYPFVHLNVDGNLFIFANNRSILLDYRANKIVRTFPPMPGGDPRSYPSSGSSVLLPLKSPNNCTSAEVLICGGAPAGSYEKAVGAKVFVGALATCGRITITSMSPSWTMETMPVPRVMGDMLLLPTGDVLIINGAMAGTAGWELGRSPATSPVIYQPNGPPGSRFELQSPSVIPRMYHSSAVLLRDGRVLVGGSNPHIAYKFYGEEYPTDLSLEAFSPDYLSPSNINVRPIIISPASQAVIGYGENLTVVFRIPGGMGEGGVSVSMIAPSFATHSFSMNQRMLVLGCGGRAISGPSQVYNVQVRCPSSAVLAPPGYYLLFVVHQRVPSEGIWVRIM